MAAAEPPQSRDVPPAPERVRVVLLTVLLSLLTIAVGVGGFVVLKMQKEPPQRAAVPAVRTAVQVMPATRAAHRETLTGYGRARPLRRASVPAEIAATVTWVAPRLEAGLTVRTGEELVRLDPRDARAAADEAAARLKQAEARLTRARSDRDSLAAQIVVAERELRTSERELERIQELVETATSESEVDGQRMAVAIREQALLGLQGRRATAEADAATAEAEIAAARAALEKARNDVDRAVVRAPYDGTIVERIAQPGERVSVGTALFSIVDLRHIEIPVTLPASRFGEVAVGAAVDVRLREGGEVVWTGTVSRVSPRVDTERRVFEAFVDVVADGEAAAAVIAPGAFVVATLEGRLTEDVVAVPREAFVAGALFVAEPDGPVDEITGARPAVTHERHPEVVRRMPETVLLGAGIEPGELIVVTGVSEVAEGSRVLVLDADAVAADGAER
jgi:RND family efflux transporter MFP subunit